jgi:hypothetical protein
LIEASVDAVRLGIGFWTQVMNKHSIGKNVRVPHSNDLEWRERKLLKSSPAGLLFLLVERVIERTR